MPRSFHWQIVTVLVLIAFRPAYAQSSAFDRYVLETGVSVGLPGTWELQSAARADERFRDAVDVGKNVGAVSAAGSRSRMLLMARMRPAGAIINLVTTRGVPEWAHTRTDRTVAEFDSLVRATFADAFRDMGGGILSWGGTQRVMVGDHHALRTSFRRTGTAGPARVEQLTIAYGGGSLTVTMSAPESTWPHVVSDFRRIEESLIVK